MSDAIELLDPEPHTLTVEARAAVALKSSETEKHLLELAAKNKAIVAILDKPGREQAHGAAMELKRTRVAIENTSKAARDDATKFSKAVIAEEKRLVAIIEPEETRLLTLRDDWDDAMAAIKALAEKKERERIMAINERIAGLRGYVNLAQECRTSERIGALIEKLTAAEITAELYQEFETEAAAVKDAGLMRLGEIFNAKKADEDERARVKAEQEAAAEALRKQREALELEQAEAKRVADEAAAKAKAEADDLAAQRAAFQAEQEAARQAMVEQARQIAKERAEFLAEQAAAIAPASNAEPDQALAQTECAPLAIETVAPVFDVKCDINTGSDYSPQLNQMADLLGSEPLILSGQTLSIAIHPSSPPVNELIGAVATTFNVPMFVAAEWLTNAADEIAEYQ